MTILGRIPKMSYHFYKNESFNLSSLSSSVSAELTLCTLSEPPKPPPEKNTYIPACRLETDNKLLVFRLGGLAQS